MTFVLSKRLTLVVGHLALFAIFASVGFSVFFAVIFTIKKSIRESLFLAAAGLNVVNFLLFGAVLVLEDIKAKKRRSYRNSRRWIALVIVSALVGLLAGLSTLASLSWLQWKPARINGDPLDVHNPLLKFVEFGVAGAALLLQLVFVCFQYLSSDRGHKHRRPLSLDLMDGTETSQFPESPYKDGRMSPYVHKEPASSPTASTYSDETKTTRAASLSQDGSRPMSSRSKLVQGTSRDQNSSTVGFSAFQNDEIESTSADLGDRSSTYSKGRGATNIAKRLEPIPGSRPNSPGRALDGPFPADMAAPKDSIESGTRSSSRYENLHSIKTSDDRGTAWPLPDTRDSGASSPAVVDESNIHPLFRTDSPMPPPTPTPGTSVHGVTVGGVVRARSFSRTSSSSQPTSPAGWSSPQLVRSRSGSQTGPIASRSSVTGASNVTQSIDQLREARSLDGLKAKATMSHPEPTPPLPT